MNRILKFSLKEKLRKRFQISMMDMRLEHGGGESHLGRNCVHGINQMVSKSQLTYICRIKIMVYTDNIAVGFLRQVLITVNTPPWICIPLVLT